MPPGASERLTEANLNASLDTHSNLRALDYLVRSDSVSMVGRFSGRRFGIRGRFEIPTKRVLRYKPVGMRSHGLAVPATVIESLVQSGRLDIDLKELISLFSPLEVRSEEGYLVDKAGVK